MGVVEGFREPPFWSCKDYICKTGTVLLFKNKNTLPPKTNKQTKRQISSIQLLSRVQLFAAPWTAAHQATLFITDSCSLLKLMSIELVMPSNHLILCCALLLLPSIFPSIRVFSNESVLRIRWPKYWSFSFNISSSPKIKGQCVYHFYKS